MKKIIYTFARTRKNGDSFSSYDFDKNAIEKKAKEIINQGIAYPGHIFNLGHGVFPSVDPEVLKRLTAFIHEYSARMK